MSPDKTCALQAIEQTQLFKGTRHRGTRAALIAAGLVRAEQFPGEAGCGKTSTIFPAEGDRRKLQVSRRSPNTFDVVVYFTPAERKEYEVRAYAEIEARAKQYKEDRQSRDAEAMAKLRRQALAEVGPRGIADASMQAVLVCLIQAFNMESKPDIPYSFDGRAIEEVKDLINQIGVLHASDSFKPKLAAVAEADPTFQRFMGKVTDNQRQEGGALS